MTYDDEIVTGRLVSMVGRLGRKERLTIAEAHALLKLADVLTRRCVLTAEDIQVVSESLLFVIGRITQTEEPDVEAMQILAAAAEVWANL